MKRLLLACLFLLMASASVLGQNTTVSGTITDTPDGQAWFGGTFSFVFRVSPSNPTAQYFFNGAPFSSSQTIAGSLDASGHYSQGVPPNTSITPSGSTWDVTFCPLATAQCVTYQSVTVTGATQTFGPSPASIRINLAVPLQNPRAYTDAEVVNGALGQTYFNVTISQPKVCNFIPCGWATLGGGGGTPANPVGSVQVNVAGSFGPGPQVSTVDIKPKTTDNICYVSAANGNDANDGLSIGNAKLTPYSCLTTVLPGGNSTHAGNGTILISGTPNAGGPVANQGLEFMGPNDPNYASPPSGFLKVNDTGQQTFALTIDCYAKFFAITNGHTGACGMLAGNAATSLPAIWISSIGGNITFNNLQFIGGVGNYAKIGIDSNNGRTANSGSSGIAFNNVAMANGSCTNTGQTGPTIDIGGSSFWIWFRGNTFGGCPPKIFTVAASGAVRSGGTTTITTTAANDVSTGEMLTIANVTDDSFNGSFIVTQIDTTHFSYPNPGPNNTSGTGQVVTARSAAINMDPGSLGALVGLVFIDDTNLNGGNIRYRGGQNGGSFYVRNVSYEGNFVSPDAPVVLITSTSSTSNGDGTNIHIENVEIADATSSIPGVQVDNPGGLFPDLVVVSRIAGYTRGKMTVLGNASVSLGTDNATYIRKQQYGMRNGQLTATGVDVARRGFSPVVAKGVNLANVNPTSWTFNQGTGTITPGINTTGLDNTSNAGRVAYSSGTPGATVQFYSSSNPLNIGDIYVFGLWARSATNNGYSGNQPPVIFAFTSGGHGAGDGCAVAQGVAPGSGVIYGNFAGSVQSDGQWQWYSGICVIAANPSTPGTFFGAQVDATHTTDFYAPTLVLLPAGSISINEAYEMAINMSPWPTSAASGEVSMLPNQRLHHGTTTFASLGTPNNASDIYCTDCVANSNPCVGTGTGAFAQGINGAWVCGGGGGGGGCAPGGITDALQYNGGGTCSFGGVNSPTVNGNYVVNYNVTASAAVPPTINLPGVPINPQTGTTYTEGSANTSSDRGYLVTASNAAAQTYTMVNPSNAGFGFNYFNVLDVIGAGAVTENASGFTVNGGASFLTPSSWLRWLWSNGVGYSAEAVPTARAFPPCLDTGGNHYNKDANGNLICGTSASGNGLSGMTAGQVPIAASATSVTSSEALAGAGAAITTGPATSTSLDVVEFTGTGGQIADTGVLFSNVWRKDAANISLGVNHDFSAGTWKIPAAAGFTAGATSNLGLDTTAKLFHCYLNNADAVCSALSSISPATTTNTIANGNNPQTWNWAQTTNTQAGMTFGETSAATGGTLTGLLANQQEVSISTASASTATPLNITQGSITGTVGFPALQVQTTWNNASLAGRGLLVSVTNTSSAAGSSPVIVQVGGSTKYFLDTAGNSTQSGNLNAAGAVTLTVTGSQGQASNVGLVYQGGADGSTVTEGAGTFRGGDNTNTGVGAAGGAATLRGGDETGATANATTGGAVTIRGGSSASTGTPTPGAITMTGGAVAGAATNAQGGVVTIAGGLGTGNAAISNLKLQTPGFSAISGTTAQAQVTRYITHAKAGSTTSATATNMFQIPAATNQTIGVEVIVHVETTQATPQNCSTSETFVAAVQNTASTITQQTTAGTIATICSTGTLTLTAGFSAATPSVFSVTPSWTTIAPTAVIITVEIHNLSQQDITLL